MNKRAMIALETVVFLTVVVLAFVAMFGYLRGALQGSWKKNVDTISDGQFEQGASTETDSDIITIKSPKIKAQVGASTTDIDVATYPAGTIRIGGWGTYE